MDETAALAAAAAATLVSAMATDAWRGVRDSIAGLFHRHGRQHDIAARLDEHAELVARAPAPDDARRALRRLWTRELTALIHLDPTHRESLSSLVANHEGVLSGAADRFPMTQTNVSHGSGALFAVQGGDIHIHGL
jgi:hypothetical protein